MPRGALRGAENGWAKACHCFFCRAKYLPALYQVRDDLFAGYTALESAKRSGVAFQTAVRVRNEFGLPSRQKANREVQGDEALRMLEDGVSYAEVARTLGINETTVAKWFPGYAWDRRKVGLWAALMRSARKVGIDG